MGPYVTRVGPDVATVLWVTEPNVPAEAITITGGTGTLRAQVSTRLIGDEDGGGLQHVAEVTGLRPATPYRYVLSDA
jgi:hypothetical protein